MELIAFNGKLVFKLDNKLLLKKAEEVRLRSPEEGG